MGLLPFDDWIYHLPYMRDQVNSKHDQVVQTQDTVQSDVLAFNKQLEKFKLLLVNNSILLYISTTAQMDDLKLADFTTQIDALPDPVKGDTVLNAAEGGTELIGGASVLKFIVNIGKLAKQAIAGTSEEMAAGETEKLVESLGEDALDAGITSVEEAASTESLENIGEAAGEEVTEAVVESSTSAALASTGIGIFLAVGVDVIFAAINGAKERDALQGILDKLDAKMAIVNKYLTTVQGKRTEIDGKTVDGISTFQKVASEMTNLLPAGHKPTFSTDFPPTLESLDKCLADQQLALTQFSLLIQLRNTYVKALKRNPNVTKDTIINAVLLTAPDWVTYDMLESIWTQVLAKYSNLIAHAS
ncbi:hypothetical protein IWW34DRAFT_852023 [Fusarium oxysporum f. sp. albedinis]|nr:hypothetical protein IWW34DRAFT_852023 [Fusarium oxysporum f. sp. albedinis]KAJ0132787.1 Uncharacterized protein HZ326_24134 [Fusarium oxysporum f. sp. albedinis]KAK2472636.1 hypothetical protein H9L39_14811 [Fusarium oxysporum f. sp. albedinis]